MKTAEEISNEIKFQKEEYDRIKVLTYCKSMPELTKQEYTAIMGRHAARIQTLQWVLDA